MISIDHTEVIKGLFYFLRIGAILLVTPYFGEKVVPVQVRVLLTIALTLFVFPMVSGNTFVPHGKPLLEYVFMGLREVLIGVTVGFMAKLIFEGIIMAASLVGYQMGFGTANLLFPGSDDQMNAFTLFHRLIVLLIFLSMNLHYIFINAISETFSVVPIGHSFPEENIAQYMLLVTSQIFVIALQLSTPILIALLLTVAALGLIARTVPQMNVFTMSFPLSFFIGLFTYLVTTMYFPEWLKNYYLNQGRQLFEGIHLMHP